MKQAYISTHLADAQSAGARFHLNPIILLAQAALESGWGTSRLAREANNHFGITGYGASNAFWHGGRVTARYKRGELLFRRYDSARNSYLDFARLLVCSYPQAAAMSRFPADYAKASTMSLGFAGKGQYQDTGAKMIHLAPHTSSDRKSTRLNSSHSAKSRMPSSA